MLTHHAYFIEDSLANFEAYVEALRESETYKENDPDFVARQYDKFGIDESRELIELSSLRHAGARALFCIGTASITTEAQQALLKLFEEPQAGTVFVLLVPQGTLLPTLRSRMLEFPERLEPKAPGSSARRFLASRYAQRSDWIKKLIDADDDAREAVRTFLNELEVELAAHEKDGRDIREGLEDVQHFRGYLSDKAPSLKMILEHFAVTLPVFDA